MWPMSSEDQGNTQQYNRTVRSSVYILPQDGALLRRPNMAAAPARKVKIPKPEINWIHKSGTYWTEVGDQVASPGIKVRVDSVDRQFYFKDGCEDFESDINGPLLPWPPRVPHCREYVLPGASQQMADTDLENKMNELVIDEHGEFDIPNDSEPSGFTNDVISEEELLMYKNYPEEVRSEIFQYEGRKDSVPWISSWQKPHCSICNTFETDHVTEYCPFIELAACVDEADLSDAEKDVAELMTRLGLNLVRIANPLKDDTYESELWNLFKRFGRVTHVYVPPGGNGFVNFKDREGAERAIEKGNGSKLKGTCKSDDIKLRVEWAHKRPG